MPLPVLSPPPAGVAAPGRRLKRGFPLVTVIVGGRRGGLVGADARLRPLKKRRERCTRQCADHPPSIV
ncbi:hypothetical protein HR12_26100 [Microbacterium sp. SUBG005]|nr:hypothetical protein HR12_26100 [Microbacterium sp. SUBG005]